MRCLKCLLERDSVLALFFKANLKLRIALSGSSRSGICRGDVCFGRFGISCQLRHLQFSRVLYGFSPRVRNSTFKEFDAYADDNERGCYVAHEWHPAQPI